MSKENQTLPVAVRLEQSTIDRFKHVGRRMDSNISEIVHLAVHTQIDELGLEKGDAGFEQKE